MLDLVRIRASQINSCAYSIVIHTNEEILVEGGGSFVIPGDQQSSFP